MCLPGFLLVLVTGKEDNTRDVRESVLWAQLATDCDFASTSFTLFSGTSIDTVFELFIP
jgi:hypothetical protein